MASLSKLRGKARHKKIAATHYCATAEDAGGDEGGGGGAPEWLPEGAVAYADFVNGHYYAGGAETTLDAILNNTAWLSAGVGLTTGVTNTESGDFLGAFAAAMMSQANATIVSGTMNANNSRMILQYHSTSFDTNIFAGFYKPNASVNAVLSDWNGDEAADVFDGSGSLRFASKYGASLTLSAIGREVVSLVGIEPSALAGVSLNGSNAIVQTIEVRAASDADLPALSALS